MYAIRSYYADKDGMSAFEVAYQYGFEEGNV